jgi:hypothetical protein
LLIVQESLSPQDLPMPTQRRRKYRQLLTTLRKG